MMPEFSFKVDFATKLNLSLINHNLQKKLHKDM